jgi:hypothetical protein
MNLNLFNVLGSCVLLSFLSVTTAHAQALEILNPPIKISAKKKTNKASRSGSKAKFDSGSQETKKERSARLSRECKGQTNAGACSGYTR